MISLRNTTVIIGITCLLITLIQCQGDNLPPNPYDAIQDPDDLSDDSIPLASLEGLQTKVFGPTCANSGCHDGTFEPDFRTAEASYNSLVYQPIIKNYVSNPLTYRALPFNASNSMILRRLTEDIDGISGIMPLATEPDSDWETNKENYIAALSEWINAGCSDLLGNIASTSDYIPQLKGFQVTATGSTLPFPRAENYSIQVPSSTTSIDLWFALSDESGNSLLVDSLFLSYSRDNYSNSFRYAVQSTGSTAYVDYYGISSNYSYKVTIPSPDQIFLENTFVFAQIRANDGVNIPVLLPGPVTLPHIKNYYSFRCTN